MDISDDDSISLIQSSTNCISDSVDVILDSDRDPTIGVALNPEVGEDELVGRYMCSGSEQERNAVGLNVTIFHPDDNEIIARYGVKTEEDNDVDIDVVISRPNDDVIVMRYNKLIKHVPMDDKHLSKDEKFEIPEQCTSNTNESMKFCDHDTCRDASSNRDNNHLNFPLLENNLIHDGDLKPISDPFRLQQHPFENDPLIDESHSPYLSESDMESPIDDDVSRLSSSIQNNPYYDTRIPDDVRPLLKPGCSSHHDHNITVYNLCCDKDFHSTFSVEGAKCDVKNYRGSSRSAIFRSILNNVCHPTIYEDRQRKGLIIPNQFRNEAETKNVTPRSDHHLLHIIHSLEKQAQNIESHCFEARRSLRKTTSRNVALRLGTTLKRRLSPLISKQNSLLRELPTTLPNVPPKESPF